MITPPEPPPPGPWRSAVPGVPAGFAFVPLAPLAAAVRPLTVPVLALTMMLAQLTGGSPDVGYVVRLGVIAAPEAGRPLNRLLMA